jgi:hypothetical protein
MEPSQEITADIRGARDVSRAYRGFGGPEVPPELDRVVLRHARHALARPPLARPPLARPPLARPARARPRRFMILGIAMAGALGTAIAVLDRDTRHIGPALQLLPVISSGANGGRLQSQQLYSTDPLTRKDPRRWRAEIAALREAGRHAEADAAYREFLAAYPRDAAHRPVDASSEW